MDILLYYTLIITCHIKYLNNDIRMLHYSQKIEIGINSNLDL